MVVSRTAVGFLDASCSLGGASCDPSSSLVCIECDPRPVHALVSDACVTVTVQFVGLVCVANFKASKSDLCTYISTPGTGSTSSDLGGLRYLSSARVFIDI